MGCTSHESSSTKVGDQSAIFVEEDRSALELGAVEALASALWSHILEFKSLTMKMASQTEPEFESDRGEWRRARCKRCRLRQ